MQRRAQTVVAYALLAASAALLIWTAFLVIRPAPAVFGYPLQEDGYYALSVARHLAAGHGLTADGVHRTTGIQPLWVLILTPFASLAHGERSVLVRAALALHWIFYVGATTALAAFAGRLADALHLPARSARLIAAFLYLSNTTIRDLHFNGLETGLVLFLYAIAATLIARVDWRQQSTPWAIGVMCGVLAVARVDAVFFAVLAVPCAVRIADAGGLRRWCVAAFTVPAIAALCLAPWLAVSWLQSGRLMPSGGAAQAAHGVSLGRLFVAALIGAAQLVPLPFDSLRPELFARAAAIVLSMLFLTALLHRRSRQGVLLLLETHEARVVLLLIANAVALMVWYGATSRAWWMYPRYASPAAVAAVPAIAVALVTLRGSRFLVIAAILLAAGGLSAGTTRALPTARADRHQALLTLVDLVERTVPAEASVGALQSGTLGFFRDHVVNLDGKANEDALKRAGDLPGYCRDEHIEWVADWPFLLERDFFGGPPRSGWRLVTGIQVEGCPNCTFAVYTSRPSQP